MTKYIKFVDADDCIRVENTKGEFLGKIVENWVGRKLRWTFEPDDGTYHTAGCLRQIADKLAKLEARQ